MRINCSSHSASTFSLLPPFSLYLYLLRGLPHQDTQWLPMRYVVEACFSTGAAKLVLSSAPGEEAVLLVADTCSVELRLRRAHAGEAEHKDASRCQQLLLEAQPWDTARLRLRVNDISYGTGPLLLRDRDRLTLQACSSPGKAKPCEYTYTITRLADATSRAAADDGAAATPGGAAVNCVATPDVHATIAANMSEYAKWNNFYAYRFGSGDALTPAAASSACGGGGHCFRRCCCGRLLPTNADAFISAGYGDVGDDATAAATRGSVHPSASSQLLVTLFPSVPSLLACAEADERHPQEAESCGTGSPAVVMCCACPFAASASSTQGGRALRPGAERQRTRSPREPEVKNSTDAARGSSRKTPWAAYAVARAAELPSTASPLLHDVSFGAASARPSDRTSAELLLRLASVEEALMGCRYE